MFIKFDEQTSLKNFKITSHYKIKRGRRLSEGGHINPVAVSATDITDSTHINLNVENTDSSNTPLPGGSDKDSEDEEHVMI